MGGCAWSQWYARCCVLQYWRRRTVRRTRDPRSHPLRLRSSARPPVSVPALRLCTLTRSHGTTTPPSHAAAAAATAAGRVLNTVDTAAGRHSSTVCDVAPAAHYRNSSAALVPQLVHRHCLQSHQQRSAAPHAAACLVDNHSSSHTLRVPRGGSWHPRCGLSGGGRRCGRTTSWQGNPLTRARPSSAGNRYPLCSCAQWRVVRVQTYRCGVSAFL